MIKKLCMFYLGEVIIGIVLAVLLFIPVTSTTYFILRFLRLSLSITFYIFMYWELLKYKNKNINTLLFLYFLVSIYFISNVGNISLLQWTGYKIGRFILNIL